MNAAPILLTVWWLALVGVFGFLASSAFNNLIMIGIRAYPRAEHRRRYEQWTLLPLIGVITSTATGLAAGLVITGGWAILWGVNVLLLTFAMIVNLGLWLGVARRDHSPSNWEPGASLEAIHAEVTSEHVREPLTESLLLSYMTALKSRQRQMKEPEDADSDGATISGLSWRDRPWGGVGVIKLSNDAKLRIPVRQVLTFMKGRTSLLIITAISVAAACCLLFCIPVTLLKIALIAVMSSVPILSALMASRAELIYRNRSRLERAEMIQDALEAIHRRRSEGVGSVSRGTGGRGSLKGRTARRRPKGRAWRLAGQIRERKPSLSER